ncbi:hypothetical protein ACPXAT_27210, partial [Klebsiella pneumoniae]|uniref:hypothetical protein n=1 Tax=Klebsiella pneumoniae TaxID=573 RepID=UPI003CEF07D4
MVGDYPSVYNSEDTVWYVIRGDIIIGTSQNILWEGGAFMRGDQTIYPRKRLSECQNGWCFVW